MDIATSIPEKDRIMSENDGRKSGGGREEGCQSRCQAFSLSFLGGRGEG